MLLYYVHPLLIIFYLAEPPQTQEQVVKCPKGHLTPGLVSQPLTEDQWAQLDQINAELTKEYAVRREMLLTRCDVTVQSFRWSDKIKVCVYILYIPIVDVVDYYSSWFRPILVHQTESLRSHKCYLFSDSYYFRLILQGILVVILSSNSRLINVFLSFTTCLLNSVNVNCLYRLNNNFLELIHVYTI